MKKSLKNLLVQIIIFILIFFSEFLNSQNVTLQLKWKHQFQFAGYYAAIEKGYYKEVGINVKLAEAVEGQNPSEQVFEGKAEFGVSTSDIVLMRKNKKDAVVLATIFQHSPQILLASKKSGIEYVQDLIGKRIAMEPNAADIIAYMIDEGVSLDKCTIDQHNFDTNILIDGKIDAISAYLTDEVYSLKQANFDYTIISPSTGGIDFYGDVLFTTEKLINSNPELVKNFREASLKGWKYAMENQEEIIQLIYNKFTKRHSIEHLRFEADKMKNLIMASVVEIGYTNPGRWESIVITYKKLKMLDPSFTIKGMLYSDYIKSKTNIQWDYIIIIFLIILVISSFAYFFYNATKKLKFEIKNRSKIQQELVKSEEKYRTIFENNSAAMAIVEPDTTISMVNEAYTQMSGYSKQEVIGLSWTKQIPPDDLERLKEYNRRRLLNPNDAPDKYEFTFYHKNGEIKNSIMSVMMFENNKKVITSFIDITERKKLEKNLRESEKFFRDLFENAPIGIFHSNFEGRLHAANPTLSKMLGYTSPEELISMTTNMATQIYVNPEKRAEIMEALRKNESWVHYEVLWKRKDGNIITVDMIGRKVLNSAGEFAYLEGFIEDITERKWAEAEIKLKNQELQLLNAEKDKFFSIIAHDLKSPFHGFLGLTDIIAEELPTMKIEQIQKYAVNMRDSASNLYRLLENLLQWSLLQQGLTKFIPSKVQLKQIINESVLPIKEIANKKKIEVKISVFDNFLVISDINILQTIIRNLVSNAVKFTHQFGEINISAKYSLNNYAEICVNDTGIGMDKKMIENLFRIDVKTSRKGTNNEPSTGLGLILCKELVKKNGGNLWVESEEGKGSKFYFTIPSNIVEK